MNLIRSGSGDHDFRKEKANAAELSPGENSTRYWLNLRTDSRLSQVAMQSEKKKTNVDPKVARPRTIAQARDLILQTFREQDWNDHQQQVYCTMHQADLVSPEGVRKLIAAMERSRMILFL